MFARAHDAAPAERRRQVTLRFDHTSGVQTISLSDRRAIVFGRGVDADVVVSDPSLCERHARMRRVGGHLVVEDLESRSGIEVRGERVTRAELRVGEALLAGDVEIHVLDAPNEETSSRDTSEDGVVIASDVMRALHARLDRVAEAPVSVLLLGETGVGKEVVARSIHARSALANAPFLAVNCGAIPKDLIESTLFGHEKGAFTGATERRAGVFEAAGPGYVFLDEVGELRPQTQVALLRVLDTRRVTAVGAHEERAVDCRIIAATHRDLEAMVARGEFREDLLWRLRGIAFEIPPLRERKSEIRPLALEFLADANTRFPNGRVKTISEEVMTMLESLEWRGNVRELKNAIESAVVIGSGPAMCADDLPSRVLDRPSVDGPTDLDASENLKTRTAAFEANCIRAALEATNGNQTEAAKRLGIAVRTLVDKIKKHGLKKRYE